MMFSSFICCLKAVLTDAPDFYYFNSVVPHTFSLPLFQRSLITRQAKQKEKRKEKKEWTAGSA
jgi:hypothetical protein